MVDLREAIEGALDYRIKAEKEITRLREALEEIKLIAHTHRIANYRTHSDFKTVYEKAGAALKAE